MGVDVSLEATVSPVSSYVPSGCTHCVPCVDAVLVCVLEDRQSSVLVQNPRLPLIAAEAHGAQDDLGDLQAGLAQATQWSAIFP